MQHYYDNVTLPNGYVVPGASVLVQSNGVAAALYSDNGVTPKANPLTTDATGSFDFYAANGTYTVVVTPRSGSATQAFVTLFDINDVNATAIGFSQLAASTGSSLIGFSHSGSTSSGTVAKKLRQIISVTDAPYNATGDGTTDDTAAIQAAITAAAGKRLKFPNGRYKFTSPLVINGIDVDFDGSDLYYAGAVGSFALTLISNAGAGSTQTNGNVFSDFTLYQSDFTEYVTKTATVTYDPPSLAAFSSLTDIVPGGISTTVSCTGATVGGYARATFDQIVDGVEITARVTAPDVVTVTFSSTFNSAVDMASGSLTVNVVNNAYHGLCLGGSQGNVRNAKVRGFTGLSVGFGDGIDMVSGVTLSGSTRCYYWDVDVNTSPAAGWNCNINPRNNVNEISLVTFPGNYYGDHRSPCINALVIGGIANKFRRCSLETNPSEESVIILGNSNGNESVGVIYYEQNSAFPTPPMPRFKAKRYSSANRIRFRHANTGRALVDYGTANEFSVIPSQYINGMQSSAPSGSRNLVVNGDFENGLSGWGDFSTGGTWSIPGTAGLLSGKKARVDLTSGKPNLQQSIDTVSGVALAGLIGRNITVGCWIKTNIAGVQPRLASVTGQAGSVGDETEEFICTTMRVPEGAASLPLSIITSASGLTGYVEVSNITAYVGLTPAAMGHQRTQPSGSATYNPPSLATGTQTSTTVTVTGAALGDYVIGVSFSLDTQGIKLTGVVSATDTVTVTLTNGTAGTIDLASGTLRALVSKV